MTESEFLSISWADRFIVEYTDGSTQVLSSDDGVSFSPAEDDPTGRGYITAFLPRRGRGQKRMGRVVYFDELACIRTEHAGVLWSASTATD